MKLNFFQKIYSLFFSLIIWAKSGFKVAKKKVFLVREGTCNSCEKWEKEAYFKFGGCSVCGCSKLKLYLKSSKCPLDKW